MNSKQHSAMYWIHTLTPLHVGAGRGIGFIDLPIMREKVTKWPYIPGSAIKGVWRDTYKSASVADDYVQVAFGREESEHSEQVDTAGSLVLTDARLLLLPVRSFYGTFAYVTSPLALRRFKRDMAQLGQSVPDMVPENKGAMVCADSVLVDEGRVYLEDLDFDAEAGSDVAQAWAACIGRAVFADDWQALFKERFVILPDDSFDFLCEHATEVQARVRIQKETKSVVRGGLWYEESLPAESVLYGMVWCDRIFGETGISQAALLQTFAQDPLDCQIGGKANIGRGQVRCTFVREEG